MERHRFEPATAIAGSATVVGGAIVVGFGVERLDPTFGLVAAAAALGLAVIPWRGRAGDDSSRHDDMT